MKKFLSLIIVLLFTVSCKVNTEGLLPELTDIYGVEMPSFSAVVNHLADSIETLEDGSDKVTFTKVSENDFDAFSDYMDEYGCKLINYSIDGAVFNATIGKQGASFTLSYDQTSEMLILVYPKGTYEENEKNALIRNIKDGEIYIFGSYEQDDDTSNGREPIEWIILEKIDDGSFVLISRYALDCKPFNMTETAVSWETCSLRIWLNDKFYNIAFNEEEKAHILTTTVTADENPGYNINQGNATQDKVYILSIMEAEKYFSSNTARKCAPTKYAIEQGAFTGSQTVDGLAVGWWWLRSLGSSSLNVSLVFDSGSISTNGRNISETRITVRPVICVRLF